MNWQPLWAVKRHLTPAWIWCRWAYLDHLWGMRDGGPGSLRFILAIATLVTGLSILFDVSPENPVTVFLPRVLGGIVVIVALVKFWALRTNHLLTTLIITHVALAFWGWFCGVLLYVTGGRFLTSGLFLGYLLGTFLVLRHSGAIWHADRRDRVGK